jgi:phosphate transport system substrate-binding protein
MNRIRRREGGAAGRRSASLVSRSHVRGAAGRPGFSRYVPTARRSPLSRLVASLAAVILVGSAAPAIASAASVITISGATASFPLVQLLAHKYSKLEHNKVTFRISQGGATVGVNDVAAGRVTIGDVSRENLPTDPAGLYFYPIAEYGICIVTNKSNPVSSLDEAQVQAIFSGNPPKDKEWSQVPGATASGPIDLISRTSTAGVLTNFKTLFLANKSVAATATEAPSEGQLAQDVANDPRGIGFLSNYRADQGTVHAVAYNGVACTRANVASGQYTATARFYEVTKGPATGAAAKFISWIRTTKAARKIISTQWVPVKAS